MVCVCVCRFRRLRPELACIDSWLRLVYGSKRGVTLRLVSCTSYLTEYFSITTSSAFRVVGLPSSSVKSCTGKSVFDCSVICYEHPAPFHPTVIHPPCHRSDADPMTSGEPRLSHDRAVRFLGRCTIDALIPYSADTTLDSLLNDAQTSAEESKSSSLAAKVGQRDVVFLGKHATNCSHASVLRLIAGSRR